MRRSRSVIFLSLISAFLYTGCMSDGSTYAVVVTDLKKLEAMSEQATSLLYIGQDATDPSIWRISGALYFGKQLDCGPNRDAAPCSVVDLKTQQEVDAYRSDLLALLDSFRKELDKGIIRRIRLNSGGGVSGMGVALASLIAEYPIDTEVAHDAICVSACVEIFMAGKNRDAHGTIGVHSDGVILEREMTSWERSDAARMASLRNSIRLSNKWPPELIELADSTPFEKMAVLTRAGKTRFGLLPKVGTQN